MPGRVTQKQLLAGNYAAPPTGEAPPLEGNPAPCGPAPPTPRAPRLQACQPSVNEGTWVFFSGSPAWRSGGRAEQTLSRA